MSVSFNSTSKVKPTFWISSWIRQMGLCLVIPPKVIFGIGILTVACLTVACLDPGGYNWVNGETDSFRESSFQPV
jgi:hypothetical protein